MLCVVDVLTVLTRGTKITLTNTVGNTSPHLRTIKGAYKGLRCLTRNVLLDIAHESNILGGKHWILVATLQKTPTLGGVKKTSGRIMHHQLNTICSKQIIILNIQG